MSTKTETIQTGLFGGLLLTLSACMANSAPPAPAQPTAVSPLATTVSADATANPANWPTASSPKAITDATTESKIGDLLGRMTLKQKIGQLVQADIGSIQPADLETYPLGSLLVGGNGGPEGKERATPAEWDKMVRSYRSVTMRPAENGIAIPLIFGIDAVHGHNNIPGATLFPHNVGLGAARDPELLERIGQVTAAEVAGTGIEWTFAPTLAVPQDLRWGRAYEGYSSDPSIVAAYSKAMVRGLQGELQAGRQLDPTKVASTAKHFVADGGTHRGQDQGDAQVSEAEIVSIHAAGYPPAIDAGALTVMASFSSWNGVKHHGNRSLLTDVLKDRMGFEGFIVGDWNGHGQIKGCKTTDCPQALMAGLDLYMAPDSWKGLFKNLLAQAEAGEIPMSRIDDAVRRILRVKYKLGLMNATPTNRTNTAVVGAPAHLAVAREAVSKSLVLLKNEFSVLPIKPGAKVLVAGPGANSMAMQSGGWTIDWQGVEVTKADFPNGQTIWEGIAAAVGDAGGKATLSEGGSFSAKPDVAIVVFGETPYAEFQGDIPHLDFQPKEAKALALLEKLKSQGIPVVSVFLSGRPMFVSPEIDASDAFVAAWLPGSQAAGVADVLVAGSGGKSKRDFTGTLSFAWPSDCKVGGLDLFPLGFGGNYSATPSLAKLGAVCELTGMDADDIFAIFSRGLKPSIDASVDGVNFRNLKGTDGNLTVSSFDIAAQEDARSVTWTGPNAPLLLKWPSRKLPEAAAIEFRIRVANAPATPINLKAIGDNAGDGVDLAASMKLAEGKDWRTVQVPVACLANDEIDGISIASASAFSFDLENIRIVPQAADLDCTGAF